MVIALRQHFSVPPPLPLTSPSFFSHRLVLQPTFISHLPSFLPSPMFTVICEPDPFPLPFPFVFTLYRSPLLQNWLLYSINRACSIPERAHALCRAAQETFQGPVLFVPCAPKVWNTAPAMNVWMLCIMGNTGVCVMEGGDCNLGWILTESPPLVFSEMFGISQWARAEPQGVKDFGPVTSFMWGFASSESHPVLGKEKRGGLSSTVVSFWDHLWGGDSKISYLLSVFNLSPSHNKISAKRYKWKNNNLLKKTKQ